MDELIDQDNNNRGYDVPGDLPHSTTVLVLGIISIVTSIFYGIPGIVCGIIALVLHRKNTAIYRTNPYRFEQSYKNSTAGNICGIIGLSLSVLLMITMVGMVIWALSVADSLAR